MSEKMREAIDELIQDICEICEPPESDERVNDIVDKLRLIPASTSIPLPEKPRWKLMVGAISREAADTIDRLRAEVASLKEEHNELIHMHSNDGHCIVDLTQQLAAVTDECKAWAGLVKARDEQLAAIEEQIALPTAQVQGWKLVPVEPTEEMLNAIERAWAYGGGSDRDAYCAAISASPTYPVRNPA